MSRAGISASHSRLIQKLGNSTQTYIWVLDSRLRSGVFPAVRLCGSWFSSSSSPSSPLAHAFVCLGNRHAEVVVIWSDSHLKVKNVRGEQIRFKSQLPECREPHSRQVSPPLRALLGKETKATDCWLWTTHRAWILTKIISCIVEELSLLAAKWWETYNEISSVEWCWLLCGCKEWCNNGSKEWVVR